jgi:hypothetical protein
MTKSRMSSEDSSRILIQTLITLTIYHCASNIKVDVIHKRIEIEVVLHIGHQMTHLTFSLSELSLNSFGW